MRRVEIFETFEEAESFVRTLRSGGSIEKTGPEYFVVYDPQVCCPECNPSPTDFPPRLCVEHKETPMQPTYSLEDVAKLVQHALEHGPQFVRNHTDQCSTCRELAELDDYAAKRETQTQTKEKKK